MTGKRVAEEDGGDSKRPHTDAALPVIGNDQLEEIFGDVEEIDVKQEFDFDMDQIPDLGDSATPNLDLPSNLGTPEPTASLLIGASGRSHTGSPLGIHKTSRASTPGGPSVGVAGTPSTVGFDGANAGPGVRTMGNVSQTAATTTQTTQAATPTTAAPQPRTSAPNGPQSVLGTPAAYSRPPLAYPSTTNIHGGYNTGLPLNVGTPGSNLPGQSQGLDRNQQIPYSSVPYPQPATGTTAPRPDPAKDSAKLNDALAAAGVDIQQEEELLMQQHRAARFGGPGAYPGGPTQSYQNGYQPQRPYPRSTPFLNPYHLASYMQRVARENGMHQNFLQDSELLEVVSAACENWISLLTAKTIILLRHRRRGIPVLVQTRNKKGVVTSSATPSSQRSELSRELRNLAQRQRDLEEKRVQKRVALGIESSTHNGADENGKNVAEETLHRAANATAAMMTSGRKKYSWMTSGGGGGGAGEEKPADNLSKQSPILLIRGDNGLRYREIRTGKSVTMKDLLRALEDERMGTQKALLKGYAKLKD